MIDTVFAQMDTVTLVKSYAKERKMAPVFNYASMAHNNHFFFNGLVRALHREPFLHIIVF